MQRYHLPDWMAVLIGTTCSGKTTVIRMAAEVKTRYTCRVSISATTRLPRLGEKHGVDYFFDTVEKFAKRVDANAFAEHAGHLDSQYGTLWEQINFPQPGVVVLMDVNIAGLEKLLTIPCLRHRILPIFVTCGDEAIEERIRKRGNMNENDIQKRLQVAKEEKRRQGEFKHVIENDGKPEAAVATLHQIIQDRVSYPFHPNGDLIRHEVVSAALK